MFAADWLLKCVNMVCSGILYTSGGAFHPKCGQWCIGFPVSRFLAVLGIILGQFRSGFRGTSDADVLDPTVLHRTSCWVVLHRSLVSDEPLAVTTVCHANALQGATSSVNLAVDSVLVVVLGRDARSSPLPVWGCGVFGFFFVFW